MDYEKAIIWIIYGILLTLQQTNIQQSYNMNGIKLVLVVGIIAASCFSMSGETIGNPGFTICSITVPIKKHKDSPGHNKYAPSKWEFALIEVGKGCMRIDLPFDEYPVDVEVEMVTSPGGFWSATLTDSQSVIDGFDGIPGNYSISFYTADNYVYTGNFSIE